MRRDDGPVPEAVQRGAVDVLADVRDHHTETVLLERIVRATAQAHDMRGEDLLRVYPTRPQRRARHLAMLIACDGFRVSLALVRHFFDVRATTVESNIRRMRMLARGARLCAARLQICGTLRGGQVPVAASCNERGTLREAAAPRA